MPAINHEKRELLFKIVYYGSGCGGKTTNVEYIHRTSRPDMRGKLLSLASEAERTLFFDLLPMDLGTFHGYTIRLHLCTVPGQAPFDKTRRLILKGADGIIFVANSDRDALVDNLISAQNLEQNLLMQNIEPASLPLVVQLNKQDLPSAAPVSELRESLSIPPQVAVYAAVATQGKGVYETLKEMVRLCLRRVGDPRRLAAGRQGWQAPVARRIGEPLPQRPEVPSSAVAWRVPAGQYVAPEASPVSLHETRTRALP